MEYAYASIVVQNVNVRQRERIDGSSLAYIPAGKTSATSVFFEKTIAFISGRVRKKVQNKIASEPLSATCGAAAAASTETRALPAASFLF